MQGIIDIVDAHLALSALCLRHFSTPLNATSLRYINLIKKHGEVRLLWIGRTYSHRMLVHRRKESSVPPQPIDISAIGIYRCWPLLVLGCLRHVNNCSIEFIDICAANYIDDTFDIFGFHLCGSGHFTCQR